MSRFLAISLIFAALRVAGQSEMKTEQGFMFSPHYGLQIPGGDLKARFSNFSSIGMGVDYKFKNNLIIGVNYDWYFGNSVKDSGAFSGISGNSGLVIDQNGDFSVIRLNMQGNYVSAHLGYLLNINKKERFSGIFMSGGVGVMQHKIDILSSELTIPQINGEYEYGYDKLTYGLAVREYIGYQHFVNDSRYRFRIGVEFNQGFTQGRRTWDFNANKSGLDKRLDLTTVFKIGVIVPVYTKNRADEEFFTD